VGKKKTKSLLDQVSDRFPYFFKKNPPGFWADLTWLDNAGDNPRAAGPRIPGHAPNRGDECDAHRPAAEITEGACGSKSPLRRLSG